MSNNALLLIWLAYQHGPISQSERRGAVDKRRSHDMRARVEQPRMLGERSVRLGLGHGSR